MSMYESFRGDESIIGAGAFGSVKKVCRRGDRKVLACKTIIYDGMNNTETRAKLEFDIISSLSHQNIARFLDVEWKPRQARLYMEYYECHSLADVISEHRKAGSTLTETYIWSIIYQLSSALLYCHQGITTSVLGLETSNPSGNGRRRRILHRDIKPGNVFLSSRSETALDAVKLGDFGLGVILQEGLNPTTYAGTRRYMPPEIRSANPGHNFWTSKCDIFSLGCTLYETCALTAAFEDHVETESEIDQPWGENYSGDLERAVQKCIAFDSKQRPDAMELFEQARQRMLNNPDHKRAMQNYALLSAAERGNFETVISMLDGGADVNARSSTGGETPLHNAIISGDLALVMFLLEKGADARARNKDGLSPLHTAAASGPKQDIDTLLEILLDRDQETALAPDKRGWRPLHVAAAFGRLDTVKALHKLGSNLDSTTRGTPPLTALHISAENGQEAVLNYLLAEGASIRPFSSGHGTALHSAAQRGHGNIIRRLASTGLNINEKAQGKKGSTALHLSAAAGHTDAVVALLEAKADVEVTTKDGETALHLASKHGRDTVIDELVRYGSKTEAMSPQHGTALHIAARHGHVSAVECLLRNKANIRARTLEGETALHWAVLQGYTDVVQLLIQEGVQVNAQGTNQATPLHWAVRAHRKEVVELLIANGADPTMKTHSGDDALLLAAFYGRKNLVEYLLQDLGGMNVDAANLNGERAIHRAAQKGHAEVLRLLLEYGADAALKTAEKKTALQVAELKGHYECVQVLKRL